MRLTDKLSQHKPVLVVELKSDDPNLMNFVDKVKPYADAVRLTAMKNADDPNDPTRTAEQICFESAINIRRISQMDVVASLVCRDHPKDDRDTLRTLKRSGVDNLLALYGDRNDPPHPNYYQFASSAELIQWVRNQESTIANPGTEFCIATGSDPTRDINLQISGLIAKKRAGANLTITQPIFDSQQGLNFFNGLRTAKETIPVLIGLLVLKSEKSIKYIEEKVGLSTTPRVKERMKEKGPEEGLRIVMEVSRALWSQADGYYIIPWADQDLSTTVSLLKELKAEEHGNPP